MPDVVAVVLVEVAGVLVVVGDRAGWPRWS